MVNWRDAADRRRLAGRRFRNDRAFRRRSVLLALAFDALILLVIFGPGLLHS